MKYDAIDSHIYLDIYFDKTINSCLLLKTITNFAQILDQDLSNVALSYDTTVKQIFNKYRKMLIINDLYVYLFYYKQHMFNVVIRKKEANSYYNGKKTKDLMSYSYIQKKYSTY